MMPRFFRDMPPKSALRKSGTYPVSTFRIVRFYGVSNRKTMVVKGSLLKAYIVVRLWALLRDLWTRGDGTGIGWSIDMKGTTSE